MLTRRDFEKDLKALLDKQENRIYHGNGPLDLACFYDEEFDKAYALFVDRWAPKEP